MALTVKTDDVTRVRKDVDPHGRLRGEWVKRLGEKLGEMELKFCAMVACRACVQVYFSGVHFKGFVFVCSRAMIKGQGATVGISLWLL